MEGLIARSLDIKFRNSGRLEEVGGLLISGYFINLNQKTLLLVFESQNEVTSVEITLMDDIIQNIGKSRLLDTM